MRRFAQGTFALGYANIQGNATSTCGVVARHFSRTPSNRSLSGPVLLAAIKQAMPLPASSNLRHRVAVFLDAARLIAPPGLTRPRHLWGIALSCPHLMSTPRAICGRIPFLLKEAGYYIHKFDGKRWSRLFIQLPPTRAQIDAVLRRSMDTAMRSSLQSAASLRVALLNAIQICGKNHSYMLGILIADATNRSHGDAAIVKPLPVSLDRPHSARLKSQLTWPAWRALVYSELSETMRNLIHILHLVALFTPVMVLAPLALYHNMGRAAWLESLRESLEQAGPAFIKWGQWAATRQDMFPPDMCLELQLLQVSAPKHNFAWTRKTLEESFGSSVDELLDWIEEAPVASGSIGQVHRARLSWRGAEICGMEAGKVVAIKVKHPNVSLSIQRDFGLMMWVANKLEWFPAMRKLHLEESLNQFAAPLREQVDLSLEANNLWRFNQNFHNHERVSLPVPLYPWVSQDILMQSFEEGMHISEYMEVDTDVSRREQVAAVGSDCMLNMMLVHNLIHSDLHPGNILLRWQLPKGWLVQAAANVLNAVSTTPAEKTLMQWLQPHVVLLDVGMATELSNEDRGNMFNLFKAFAEKDGYSMALAALNFAGPAQRCVYREAFASAVAEKMDSLTAADSWEATEYEDSAAAFASILDIIREHEVTLPGHICAVLVTTLVLEGWSSRLAPEHSVLQQVKAVVSMDSEQWRERIGGTVDNQMGWGPMWPVS